MMNYTIWNRDDNEDEILVEVFNGNDVHEIQKQFVNRGYVVEEYFDTCNSSFIRFLKVKEN